MKVYRYTSIEELQYVLSGENDNLGRYFIRSACNTHRYNKNKKYLHFFKHEESIEEIKRINRRNNEYYLCVYDIPKLVLLAGRGYGYYSGHGYKDDRSKLIEYIIPNDRFKSQWLISYTKVKDKEIEIEQQDIKKLAT